MRVAVLALIASMAAGFGAVAWASAERARPVGVRGLVPLPCDARGALRPARPIFCLLRRNFVTREARAGLERAAAAVSRRYPGSVVLYMDASWERGVRPMPPHLSHGDGREVDLAIFYADREGAPLSGPPDTLNGYGRYEPPRQGEPLPCKGVRRAGDQGDPPPSRRWRLDEGRTRLLLTSLAGDRAVKRVLIEEHLEKRLGLWGHPKVRFQGCHAGRHDDHLHVDFR
jgi:hypothetical protein